MDADDCISLVRSSEAADMLAISERKLWELSARGEIPRVQFDGCVRYDPRDLMEWIEQQKAVS